MVERQQELWTLQGTMVFLSEVAVHIRSGTVAGAGHWSTQLCLGWQSDGWSWRFPPPLNPSATVRAKKQEAAGATKLVKAPQTPESRQAVETTFLLPRQLET